MIRPLLVLLTGLVLLASASGRQGGVSDSPSTELSSSYKFENKRFYIPLIEIDLASDGTAALRFKRGESDDILDRKMKLLPATLSRIRQIFDDLRFIESNEEYQGKKDFSHLGWITIIARQAGRERTVRFNFTTNENMKELAEIFRGLATQEIHLLDLDNAEQYQPLDLPRQLEALANDLQLERVTEPTQLLNALREISGNDALPLIARNQARRLITDIEKNKFKSTMKK